MPNLGPLIVSTVILALFAFSVIAPSCGLPPVPEPANKLLETALTLVLGYWIGSSVGSRAKDAILGKIGLP